MSHATANKSRKQIPVSNGEIHIRKVDYDVLAREHGLAAYRIAKGNGLSEKEARAFRRIAGAPVAPEHRVP